MTKKKLQRFAEMEDFANVVQPPFADVFGKDYYLKGNWHPLEFKNDNPIILELGCGKGEYTIELARRNPDKNFIGVDIKGSRIWRGARTALSEKLGNVRFLRTRIEVINSFFSMNEVSEIWITFPDPQLKKKRKRLTSSRFLARYAGFLHDRGLVHLKTDNKVLYEYTLRLAEINRFEIRLKTDDLYHSVINDEILEIKTFYEKGFLEQGMNINYLCFSLPHETKIQEPADEN
ncbi:MAG TPA: tRNA (guanosine(46)-N7)-methyltransferase TrmB [Bacteroidales bacterium]|jgi:tRNA (guanine-N7-)-methyltransferase|nr:tRNA (guanosine(46)-N7)-methyltransferase TrmB [Bacteroidales bacterium]